MQHNSIGILAGTQDSLRYRIEESVGYPPGRIGGSHDGMNQVPIEPLGGLECGADRGPRADKRAGNVVVEIVATVPEGVLAGLLDAERVRLVHELGHKDALHHFFTPQGPASLRPGPVIPSPEDVVQPVERMVTKAKNFFKYQLLLNTFIFDMGDSRL